MLRRYKTFRIHHFYDPALVFPSLQHISHPLSLILSSLYEKVCLVADFFDRLSITQTYHAVLLQIFR